MFASEGHVSLNRALIDKPELFSFDVVNLRPSWFVGVDSRKFRFIDVQWNGRKHPPPSTISAEIDVLADGKCGPAMQSPHDRLAQTCRELSTNAEENRDYPLSNSFQ